ncbi:MAG TPA: hypothetical protein VJ867_02260 [Gemmatimonadaceae bacterium]|nr:hypothetical protein [Gemmatimonadaceae bacterium]
MRPNAHWRTLKTQHFYIHFTPELETVARRAAVNAEDAYAKLSQHLHPPRGSIDVVISDDVDFSNGFASPFPYNHILVYANPPVFESALRFTDDPTELVITHELTHIFHLDRVGGVWKPLQQLFGRVPYFFPNEYSPSWLVEGIAVYYESALTGSGRIVGSEHRMIARTAAAQHALPRIDQLSLARPQFPYGYSAYAYGSLFVDFLAHEHGDSAVRAYIESSSRNLVPFVLNFPAHRAFGRSFTAEYRRWSDSLLHNAPPSRPPLAGWRELTHEGAYASFPRWLGDSAIVYTGTPGRESYGAYVLQYRCPAASSRSDVPSASCTVTRVRKGRRNSRSPNTVLRDGSLLYSQLEYVSPYNIRSDLYVDSPRGHTRRLTHGARLAFPDARDDGRIVAVQTLPAGTRLALVSRDGRRVMPMTSGGPDEQWTEPRWSPDGAHIVAVRWIRGGTSEVVVVDTTGRIVETLIRERAVNATPSWSRDGRYVYFSSDRSGLPDIYVAAFRAAFPDTLMVPDLQRLSDAGTGVFEPQPSPNGALLAASVFESDGYHVGIASLDSIRAGNAAALPDVAPRDSAPPREYAGAVTRYSPWRTLLPRYWLPFFDVGLSNSSARIGALTSGEDAVGRHAYQALLFVPTDNSGITGQLYYRNATLGQPLVEALVSQDWENYLRIVDESNGGAPTGNLRRRTREGSLTLTLLRPRSRTYSYLSAGAGVESRNYAASDATLLARVDSAYQRVYTYPELIGSVGWSNTQYPALAISPEDGIQLASTTRFRWRSGDSTSATTSVVATASVFKSVPLPGYAHHVLALHGSGGVEDSRGTGYYEVGGVSGGLLDVLPGYALGEGSRTFPVRGFPGASLAGIRAFSASAEYRAPFTLPGRGLGTLPLFLDRTSITLFGDAGSAWCPKAFATRPVPEPSLCSINHVTAGLVLTRPEVIASTGAELNVSAALLSWDAPVRLRLGVAVPVVGTSLVPVKSVASYLTVGASF